METARLLLRRWRPHDRAPFAALNADPRVTEFLGGPMTREASDAMAERVDREFDRLGFGLYVAEHKTTGETIGYIGLSVPTFEAHFTPCVEIGWRLAADYWGQGLATEGARAVLEHGFSACGLEEIVSFTVPANVRSRRVMEKLGLTHNPADDFDHPRIPEGHPLRRHVLYRISRPKP